MEIKKKVQKFKGKTIEELQVLDVREFAKLLPSRQRRTVLRNFQEHEKFLKEINKKIEKGKKSIKTHIRDLVVMPGLVEKRIQIYNGREFIPVDVTIEMLGHKFGEFSLTRQKAKHTNKNAPKVKSKK